MKIRGKRILAMILCFHVVAGSVSVSYAQEEQVQEHDIADVDAEVSSGTVVKMDGERETDELYGMNEDGNVYLMEEDESAAFSDESTVNFKSRAAEVVIVNFRSNSSGETISSSETTSYTEYGTGTEGYTCGAYGADAAYLGTENGKVKFMLGGVVGLVDASKVQLVKFSETKSYSCYYADDTLLYHRICTNMTTSGWGSSINVGTRPSYLAAGSIYYSYDGHYFYTDYATMVADYQGGIRGNAVNAKEPYYNYYQYLPLRSKSNYDAGTINTLIGAFTDSESKMYNAGSYFVNSQNTYGTNALLICGIAANESAWGKSNYALNRNNLFGLEAVDSNPDNATYFSSVSQCIKEFSETWMSKGYLNSGDWRYYGGFLGDKASGINVKYASDPYWGEKAAAVAWNMDKVGEYKDKERYTIGIKNMINTEHDTVNVRKESNTSSTILYSTGDASNYAVLIRGSKDGFYEIQSDPVLTSGRTSVDSKSGNYSQDEMYAYISQDYVSIVSDSDNFIDESTEGITYSVHAQTYGWMSDRIDGKTAGTVGEAKRLESLKVSLRNPSVSGGVRYRAYCQTYEWLDWAENGEEAGTTGEAKRMEAVQIELTGEMANKYDIYYRVHCQSYGWLDWAKNGEMAGSSDYAKRMEAIQIVLVEKGGNAPGNTDTPNVQSHIKYQTHVQTYGWQSQKMEGVTAGTAGEAKRLEAVKIELMNLKQEGSVEYRTHVQTYGWGDWVSDGQVSGSEGEAKRLEAIQIRLTGALADEYDIYYRVHSQTYGWLDWAKNGEYAGTTGIAKRLEAIEIRLVKKGEEAPGDTDQAYVQELLQYRTHIQSYGWQQVVSGGAIAGTREEAKRMEAVQISLQGQKYTGNIEYQVYINGEGWSDSVRNGRTAGTTGQAKAIGAIRIQLTGKMEQNYDIYYRAYCQTYGWLGWSKNGASAGTEGLDKRMEAVQIILVEKGQEAPGSTEGSFKES